MSSFLAAGDRQPYPFRVRGLEVGIVYSQKRGRESSTEYLRLPETEKTYHPLVKRFFIPIGQGNSGDLYWLHPLARQQIYRYDVQRDQIQPFVIDFPEKTELWAGPWEIPYTGLVDHTGFVWRGGNMNLLKGKAQVRSFGLQQAGSLLLGGSGILEDSYGNIWLNSQEGLHHYRPGRNGSPSSLHSLDRFSSFSQAVRQNTISLFEDRRGRLWLGNYAGLVSLDLKAQPTAFQNLALGKSVRASSIEGGVLLLPEFVLDGDLLTRWSSAFSDPQWLEVDLGKTEWIETLVLHWEESSAKSYEIALSEDGKSWRTVYATQRGQGGTETMSIRDRGRFLRMYGTERNSPYGYSLWEMEILGKVPSIRQYLSKEGDERNSPGNQVNERLTLPLLSLSRNLC